MDGGKGSRGKTPPPSGTGKAPPPVPPTASANNMVPLVIALLLVLITIAYFIFGRKKGRGRSVLLCGPCDSGKTALFSMLVGGETAETVTSVIPNELEYTPGSGKPALIVKDLPGHDRVQIKYWDAHKNGARGIIVLVDAAAGNKGVREAADVLYRVLTDGGDCPSVMVFANKQDQPMSKGMKVIRNQLEKELTTLRMTKSASLSGTSGKSSSFKMLGRPDKDFDFDQVTRTKVTFAEGSATTDENSLKPIHEWLESIA